MQNSRNCRSKKSAIQLNLRHISQSLQEIRIDNTLYKDMGFDMMKEVNREQMMAKLDERIQKLKEPTKRVEDFEARNWIQFINQNLMSVVRFYTGPVKFTIGRLDRVDRIIRQHLTHPRGTEEKRDGHKPPVHEPG